MTIRAKARNFMMEQIRLNDANKERLNRIRKIWRRPRDTEGRCYAIRTVKEQAFTLRPENGCTMDGSSFCALNAEPWLGLGPRGVLAAGSFAEIAYRASLWDEPLRPVFRFWISETAWQDKIAPGPVAGAAIWSFFVPLGTIRVSISPTHRPGRFDFELISIRTLSLTRLFSHLFSTLHRERGKALWLILRQFFRPVEAFADDVERMANSTPTGAYEAWRMERARAPALDAIDRPRFDWSEGSMFHLLVDARKVDEAELARTIASLRAQAYPRWRLDLIGDPQDDETHRGETGDPRIGHLSVPEAVGVLQQQMDGIIVAAILAGDEFYPHALGAMAEGAARMPLARVFYGDEDHRDRDGRLVPVLKPGWSPVFAANHPYFGRAVFVASCLFGDWTEAECLAFLTNSALPARIIAQLDGAIVHALRRVLVTRAAPSPEPEVLVCPEAPPILRLPGNPSALIVIPTRDQALSLSRCIESIFTQTNFDNFSLVLVDHGSIDPAAQKLLAAFRGDKAVTVLRSPGPCNLSALRNAGAARRKSDVLLFLPDFIEIGSADWLDRIVEGALRPETGAAGGLLLNRRGRIEHAGVVLGMGDGAGLFGAQDREGAAGWAGRNGAVHEVSAVTFCLGIARTKFFQVGGFDAEHFASSLGDIDLCLRLAGRGWRACVDPNARLVSTRETRRDGQAWPKPGDDEWLWLRTRWFEVLRDDPYFHPALSLHSPEAALS